MTSQLSQKAVQAVSHFAERMALYTFMNHDCLQQMRRYTAEHSAVMSVLKEILQEKYELFFILGLRAHQRKDAVQLMAVYICAAQNQDWEFFDRIIDLAGKSLPKGAIDISLLLTLYDKIIQSKNPALAYSAAAGNYLNVYSRAFYPVVAICKAHILNTEHAELILDSALNFHAQRLAFSGFGNSDSALCRYLRIAVTDKVLSGTLADVFPLDRTSLDTSSMTLDDIGNYRHRSLELSYLVALCSGEAGLLQSHAWQSITFNKEKRVKLTALTAEVCMFNSDSNALNEIAQNYLDGKQSACSASQSQLLERVTNEFSVVLRNFAYLDSCLKMYRKSILLALDIEFFNPELSQATRWVQQLEKTVERQKAEITKGKTVVKELRGQNRALTTETAEARNKHAGLQTKIEQQQKRISQLEAELEELKRQNAELRQDVEGLLPHPADADSMPAVDGADVATTDYRAMLSSVFDAHKIVFIGGYETTVMQKFAQRNPSAVVIPLARIASSEAQIENADAILFKTDHLSHSDYFKVKSIAYRKHIPFDYLGDGTNVQRLEANAVKILKAMGLCE